ncbi:MAG: O-antigen ligase family protein [Acidobacteria bacterium]|nr:O-antigen ligase family protein [Acidobacteriota bacterium]
MTPYRFRLLSAGAVFLLFAFSVLAFGAVDLWALTILEVGVFILAALWTVRLAMGRLQLVWSPFYLPWAVLALWTLAQYALGWSVYRYRTQVEALKWLALWLLFAIATQVFSDDSIRSRFRTALVWFGFALCVFGLVQYFTSPGAIYWSIPTPGARVFGPFPNRNHFSALIELIVPATLLLALRPSEQRFLYIVAVSLMLGAIVVCGSRAGTAVGAVETVVVLVVAALRPDRSHLARRRLRVWLPIAGVAAAVILTFSVAGTGAMLDRFQEQQPYSTRWNVAKATWRLFLSRPWTGYGAGTFDQVYPSAAPVDLGLFWPHAHNDPIQFAMEWGVVGLAVLAWTLWLLLSRRWPQQVWLSRVLPLLAVLAHSWFDFHFQIPAVMAAWLLTLAQLSPAALRPERPSPAVRPAEAVPADAERSASR